MTNAEFFLFLQRECGADEDYLLDRVRRRLILGALDVCRGNKTAAGEQVGLKPSALDQQLRRWEDKGEVFGARRRYEKGAS